jgi:heavy metal sensor kinase
MSSPLRARLTLWYVGAFSVVLILFSTGVYFFVERILVERMDANLRVTLRTARSALAHETNPRTPVGEALEEPRFPDQIVALVDPDGRVLARKPIHSAVVFRLPALPLRASASPQFYELPESNSEADDSCRGIYQLLTPVATSNPASIIVVTASAESLSDHLDALQNVLAIAIIVSLLLAGCGGWFLARHSLSPLAAMASATERITANNLDERLPVATKDELGRLASKFNELLSRLSASFSQQRQFMTDASHELRTPLSVVRTAAQVSLQKPKRSESEYRDALAVIEQQAARLSRIVEDMFAITRADMNQLPLDLSEVYLDEIVADTVRAAAILAQCKGVHLATQEMQEARYRGDDRLLRQMISNLLDNAVKFTPEGGIVNVHLQRVGASYDVTIADTGCGIPDELQPRIFDRFFRVDKARAGANGLSGAGLGLAIARVIAELHEGRVTLQQSGAAGSTFRICLPIRE